MNTSPTIRFKITVLTVGNKILTYTVNKYTVENGFVCFIDEKFNIPKKYPVSRTEINEVQQ